MCGEGPLKLKLALCTHTARPSLVERNDDAQPRLGFSSPALSNKILLHISGKSMK